MAGAEELRRVGLAEPAAVVVHAQHDLAVLVGERHGDLAGLGMLSHVREELARDREEESLLRVAIAGAQVEAHLEAASSRRSLGHGRERAGEPDRVEHLRVELEDRLTEVVERLAERLLGAPERRVVDDLRRLLHVVAGGEQVLDRVVVEPLGERLALALGGVQRVGEELLAHDGEVGDPPRPPGEDGREQHSGEPDPGEEAGEERDEAQRLGPGRGRVDERLREVGDHGARPPRSR